MKRTLLRLLAVFLAVFTTSAVMAADEIYYGVYKGAETLKDYGTGKAETYDVALHLADPSLVGMQICAIRIPVNINAKNTSDYKAWLTNELTVTSGKTVPDIVSVEVTPSGLWTEVRLSEPYVITEKGVYAGYSFTVSSVDGDNVDANKEPLKIVSTETEEGLLIRTSRTFRKWVGLAEKGSTAMVVCLGGDHVKSNAAQLVAPDNLYTIIGKSISTTLSLVNHGTEAIKNIDYEIEVDGKTEGKHVTKSIAGGYFGRTASISVTIPTAEKAGSYPVKFRVTKVNGLDNEDLQPETETPVVYLDEAPVHKPLVEEYTGTWCQWCPRALAGMEKMSDANGENFVGIAYHVGDEMEFSTHYPASPSGLPAVFIDRVKDFSPSTGQSEWEARGRIIAPAAITVTASWDDEGKTKVKAISQTTFIREFKDSPYRISYVLLANDLHSPDWKQSNAFSGNSGYDTGDPYLKKFIDSPNPIKDLHYNEVAIAHSDDLVDGLEESLPTDVEGNKPYTHEFTFDISANQLPLDKTKLEVVAVLVDIKTGEVINSNKGHVIDTTGIDDVQRSQFKLQGDVFDLAGRRIAEPTRGLYIQNGKKVIK